MPTRRKLPAQRHRVLIVDDDESTRMLIARLLATGMTVEAYLAGTCEEALRLAGTYAYDAILLDLLMPGIGGLEVLKEIRRGSANMATPLLVISIVSDRAASDQCMAAGADGYLMKPVERRALLYAVKAALAARGRPRNP